MAGMNNMGEAGERVVSSVSIAVKDLRRSVFAMVTAFGIIGPTNPASAENSAPIPIPIIGSPTAYNTAPTSIRTMIGSKIEFSNLQYAIYDAEENGMVVAKDTHGKILIISQEQAAALLGQGFFRWSDGTIRGYVEEKGFFTAAGTLVSGEFIGVAFPADLSANAILVVIDSVTGDGDAGATDSGVTDSGATGSESTGGAGGDSGKGGETDTAGGGDRV